MRKSSSRPPEWAFPDYDWEETAAQHCPEAVNASPVADASKEVVAAAELTTSVVPDDRGNATGFQSPMVPNSGRLAFLGPISDMVDQPFEWVWDRVIPRGELTLITGEPGVGKSVLILGIVADVTRGLTAPQLGRNPGSSDLPVMHQEIGPLCENEDGKEMMGLAAVQDADNREADVTDCEVAREKPAVILFCSAAVLRDVCRPRLIDAHADLTRLYTLYGDKGAASELNVSGNVDGAIRRDESAEPESRSGRRRWAARPWSFQMKRDLPILSAELKRLQEEGIEVRMIVIDPVDECFETAGRRWIAEAQVAKLVELAARFNVAIVMLSNSTPSNMARLARARGTLGIDVLAQAARSVWTIVRDLEYATRRVLLPVKSDLALNRMGLGYFFEQKKIEWEPTPVELKLTDYVGEAASHSRNPVARDRQYELNRAAAWLYERLSEGWVAAKVVEDDAWQCEISYSTLRRAFISLGGKSEKRRGQGKYSPWFWRLPGGMYYRAGSPVNPVEAKVDVQFDAKNGAEVQGTQDAQGIHVGQVVIFREK